MRRRGGFGSYLAFPVAALVAVVLCDPIASAQQPVPGTGVRPGDRPPELPGFRSEEPEPGLKELPPPKPRERLSDQIKVYVKQIRLEDNTAVTNKELRDEILKMLDGYEAAETDTDYLIQLINKITEKYRAAGYPNSGAVIPDQDVSDGVVLIRIVEGELPINQIEIFRLDRDDERNKLRILRDSYVRDRIALGVEKPLNVNALQERLQLMRQDPAIDNIKARLGPGVRPGDSRLEVDVVEAPRIALEVFSNNDRSVSVGEYQGIVAATMRSVLGFGDPLFISGSFSEGLEDGYARYEIPVTSDDLRLFVAGGYTDSHVVQQPFDDLDIESDVWTVELGLDYPFRRTLGTEISGGISFARRHSETMLLGLPFSFTEGVDDGEVDLSILRLVQNARWRDEQQVFAARSTLSWGLDVWNATTNDRGPDAGFFSWLGQAQYVRRLGRPGHELILRGDLQLTPDPLFSIEQFAVGGLFSVRGYRRNELVRDNGWVASTEWRFPLFRVPILGFSETPEDGLFQIAPFFDAGGGWNEDRETPSPKAIYSAGAGLRWSPAPQMSVALYYGYQLEDVREEGDGGLQDYGVYFDVRFGVDFW